MTLKRNKVMAMDQFPQLASFYNKASKGSVRSVNTCVGQYSETKTEGERFRTNGKEENKVVCL
jgi:hypothetical protein